MALQISRLSENDLEEFVEVDDLAMKGYPYAQAMTADLPHGTTRKDLIMGFMREAATSPDPNKPWYKVKDTRLDKIVAGGCREFYPERQALDDIPADSRDTDKSFLAEARRSQILSRNKSVGARPFAWLTTTDLAEVFTHPDYRRRGAASIIVKHGCDEADRYGWVSVLNASQDGVELYLKHGFEVVEEEEQDLRPWGVNATNLRRGMVRQPKNACAPGFSPTKQGR